MLWGFQRKKGQMVREEKQKKGEEEEGQERRDPVGVPQRGENGESLFSPRFKSVAAMAGWDEESILMATLIVEDTPDRDRFRNSNNKSKKRQDTNCKTPSTTTSTRKRRGNRRISIPVPVPILNLEEDEAAKEASGQEKRESEPQIVVRDKEKSTKRVSEDVELEKSSTSALPCLDKLREELSCAICLEICYEPSTTSCGHSFCKKCLRSAADKCGRKCPKCRQLISNGRSCTVNTVLWNTIQLLFPGEVEARKASTEVQNSREAKKRSPGKRTIGDVRRPSTVSSTNFYGNDRSREMLVQDEDSGWRQRWLRREEPSGGRTRRRRRGITSQDEDAALALRLQREELMESFRGGGGPNEQSVNSVSLARENLRRLSRLVRQPNRRM